jgi:hypothetical protein
MYKIINNLLSAAEQDFIESEILNDQTQWVLNRFCAYKNSAYNVSQEYIKSLKSLRHVIFNNNSIVDNRLFDIVKIIPERLGAKNLYNIICQLQLATGDYTDNTIHIDMPSHTTPYYSTVYYVNTSDAPTVLYNDDKSEIIRCEHERGKLIMFDGNILHRSSKPKTDMRCILNFCWD